MLFNSYAFLFFFLPLVLLGFFRLASTSRRLAALWLAGASLFFYGWWNPTYVLLLLTSIGGNYALGYAIGHASPGRGGNGPRRVLLVAAVLANLALLGYFKYANFFVDSLNRVTGIGWSFSDVVLPLGISFFTFTQIAFLVDVYRGIAREYSLIHYILFVTYFPHLIAGPVLHHKQMMPQFGHAETYRFDARNFGMGMTFFSLGLFKKVILADQFALYANPIFDAVANGGQPSLFEAWFGALAFAFQLYFDFSGYSDMAIGLSKMFNVDLPINFSSPYKAACIIDFWRRWHMTLSVFLRDYLYIPLGGNRQGPVRRHANLMVTMVLGGLWHGAAWTFVLWGGLHGLFLVTNHAWRVLCRSLPPASFPGARYIAMLLTFLAVVVAWVPFRAGGVDDAARMLAGMAGWNGVSLPERLMPFLTGLPPGVVSFGGFTPLSALAQFELLVWLSVGLTIVWLLPNSQEWMGMAKSEALPKRFFALPCWRPNLPGAITSGCMLGISLLALTRESQFLYFQF